MIVLDEQAELQASWLAKLRPLSQVGARDAFPMTDEGLADEHWRPWRALATVHLLAEARSQARSAFSNQ
jgi:hypothetical protein